MHFIATIASFLAASAVVVGTPIERRQFCSVGVPCVVQYEVDLAKTAMGQALADVNAGVQPFQPIVTALTNAATGLQHVAGELAVAVGPMSADAKATLSGQVNDAINTAMTVIVANAATVIALKDRQAATVTPEVVEAAGYVNAAVAAIVAVIGPCYTPVTVSTST